MRDRDKPRGDIAWRVFSAGSWSARRTAEARRARAAVEHRSDDTEAVIGRRLELYHQVTQPIIAWYSRRGILVPVDAMRPAGQVGREILAALEVKGPRAGHVRARVQRQVSLTGLEAQCGQA
ncbi:MAG TPA: hypothetical protein VGR98_10910 [Streptosporangiaceae bacterium]|nr:hypothetical protein [Streptosporangiaceae bacterium]